MFFPIYLFTVLIASLIMGTMQTQIEQLGSSQQFQGALAAQYAAENTIERSWLDVKEYIDQKDKGFSFLTAFDLERATDSGVGSDMGASNYAIHLVEKQLTDEYFPPHIQNEGHFDEFRFVDISSTSNFTELHFDYSLAENAETHAGVVVDVFIFPRSDRGQDISFGTLRSMSSSRNITRNIQRFMFRTTDTSHILTAPLQFSQSVPPSGDYTHRIRLTGFLPLNTNYILRFSTVRKDRLQYKLSSVDNGQAVDIPLSRQYAHIDAETETLNMYQRIEQTQRLFSPLQPGKQFVFFSDHTVQK